jgi:hypothetical protein
MSLLIGVIATVAVVLYLVLTDPNPPSRNPKC